MYIDWGFLTPSFEKAVKTVIKNQSHITKVDHRAVWLKRENITKKAPLPSIFGTLLQNHRRKNLTLEMSTWRETRNQRCTTNSVYKKACPVESTADGMYNWTLGECVSMLQKQSRGSLVASRQGPSHRATVWRDPGDLNTTTLTLPCGSCRPLRH